MICEWHRILPLACQVGGDLKFAFAPTGTKPPTSVMMCLDVRDNLLPMRADLEWVSCQAALLFFSY